MNLLVRQNLANGSKKVIDAILIRYNCLVTCDGWVYSSFSNLVVRYWLTINLSVKYIGMAFVGKQIMIANYN